MKTLEERLDDEKLISEFEGHRDFEKNSWHYWFIAAIAFSWSLYQLYIVRMYARFTWPLVLH